MGLILIIPDPLAPEHRMLRESVAMLTRLQARLRTLERVRGCDLDALHRKMAEVEGAIEDTRRACSETAPTRVYAAPALPTPAPMEPTPFPLSEMGASRSAPPGEQHIASTA